MKRPVSKKPVFYMLFFTAIILLIFLIMQPLEVVHLRDYIAILFPKGRIGLEERNLLFIIQGLMLLVIIPVFILTFIFSWIYRADNPKGRYDPDLIDHRLAEVAWWGIPFLITMIIAILTWVKTAELDPFKPIPPEEKTIRVQVVALDWKWLFIYPEEKVAAVNFLQIPQSTPIRFEITADAPMNSFWIPDLGGQIYAMPNMKTELHLIADRTGDFRGSSANISGTGFAGMHFITRASSEEEYRKWVEEAKKSDRVLNMETYKQLAKQSSNNPVEIFRLEDEGLFHKVLMKFMLPAVRE
jgi:cytochrome o ubiquinol oxidase subunit 2